MAALDQRPPILCSIVQEEIGTRLQLGGCVIIRQETQGNFSLRVIKNGALGFLDHRSERKFLNVSERGNDSGEPSNRTWVIAGIFGQCLFSLPGSRLQNPPRAHLLSKLLLFVGDSKFMSPIVIGLQYYHAPKFAQIGMIEGDGDAQAIRNLHFRCSCRIWFRRPGTSSRRDLL